MIERPSLHALALFLATVDHGTMTAAAAAAGISQPAISVQIKALERFYGVRLLERGKRDVVPTETGRLVAEYARRVLALVDDLGQAITDREGVPGGRLVIGASSTVGEQLLPAHLSTFHRLYPAVELELRIGNSEEITEAVLNRALHFAFVGKAPIREGIISEPIFDDEIVAFAAADDSLLAAGPLSPETLSGQQFVLRERGSATRELALHCLAEAGCTPGHIVELGSNDAVKRAVEAGLGIGLLSAHAIDAERLAGLLADLPLSGWNCARSFWLIRRRELTFSLAASSFLDVVRGESHEQLGAPH